MARHWNVIAIRVVGLVAILGARNRTDGGAGRRSVENMLVLLGDILLVMVRMEYKVVRTD